MYCERVTVTNAELRLHTYIYRPTVPCLSADVRSSCRLITTACTPMSLHLFNWSIIIDLNGHMTIPTCRALEGYI